jgi:hypothetical protein
LEGAVGSCREELLGAVGSQAATNWVSKHRIGIWTQSAMEYNITHGAFLMYWMIQIWHIYCSGIYIYSNIYIYHVYIRTRIMEYHMIVMYAWIQSDIMEYDGIRTISTTGFEGP